VTTLLVDGNNVIGSVADGWWRDRPGAVHRLVARLQHLAVTGATVEVVFDTKPPDLVEGEHGGVIVHYATRRGRDAADDRIVELVAERDGSDVEVVTSDRALADAVRAHGAAVTGAGSFLARLDALDIREEPGRRRGG
jgi:predicted RNA-binding protein with PIN domain